MYFSLLDLNYVSLFLLFSYSVCYLGINTATFEDYFIIRFFKNNLLREQYLKNIHFIQNHKKVDSEYKKNKSSKAEEFNKNIGKLEDILLKFRSQLLHRMCLSLSYQENIMDIKVDYKNHSLPRYYLKSLKFEILTFLLLLSLYCFIFYTYIKYIQIMKIFFFIEEGLKDKQKHLNYLEDSGQSFFNWIYVMYKKYQEKLIQIFIQKNETYLNYFDKYPIFRVIEMEKLESIKNIKNKYKKNYLIFSLKQKIQSQFVLNHIIFPIISW